MNSNRPLVVAIDGPSGSGKSSVAKAVADHFRWRYLDTGAMYRAVTWAVLDAGVDPHDAAAAATAASTADIVSGTDPGNPTIHVNDADVAVPIRGADVTAAVSLVSAVPQVRARLVELQQQAVRCARSDGVGIVVEGRDIGTVVLPDADLKVFLTADPAARAARRSAQDADSEHGSHGVSATKESLLRRDELDSTRTVSPLAAAADAVTVDATHMDLEQTIATVVALVEDAHV